MEHVGSSERAEIAGGEIEDTVCSELQAQLSSLYSPNQVEPRLFVPIRTTGFRVNKLFVACVLVHLARSEHE